MRVAIVNDLHYGARGGNLVFEAELKRFINQELLPYLKEEEIKVLVVAGDLFDNRKSVSVRTLNLAKELFTQLENIGVRTFIIPGNHDIYYRNTLRPNSIEATCWPYSNVEICMEPTDLTVDGTHFLLVPWVCDENEKACMAAIKDTEAQVLVTHMDIVGSQVIPGMFLDSGYEQSLFRKFDYVLNGHIHTRSEFNNIVNMGTQYQMNWSDADQQKGFHVFNTVNRTLTFVPNDLCLYQKVWYEKDLVEGTQPLVWAKERGHALEGKFVKVMVSEAEDRYLFDRFLDTLSEFNPQEITCVEDLQSALFDGTIDVDAFEGSSKSTMEIISDFINDQRLPPSVDHGKLKKLFSVLHSAALERDLLND